MSNRQPKPVIFQNESGSIQDLGVKGEYPYRSSVGRRYTVNGMVKERWYATEINPRGELDVDHNVRNVRQYLEGDRSPIVLQTLELLGFKVKANA